MKSEVGHDASPAASAEAERGRGVSLDVAELVQWLTVRGASNDVVGWVEASNVGWPEAWESCPRGDWLLAIAARSMGVTREFRGAVVSVALMVEEETAAPGLVDLAAELRLAASTGDLRSGFVADVDGLGERAGDFGAGLAFGALSLAARAFELPDLASLVAAQVAELAMANVLDCAMVAARRAALMRAAEHVRAAISAPVLVL